MKRGVPFRLGLSLVAREGKLLVKLAGPSDTTATYDMRPGFGYSDRCPSCYRQRPHTEAVHRAQVQETKRARGEKP